MNNERTLQQPWKFLSEMGPLAAFFIANKYEGLIFATAVLVFLTVISVLFVYYVERKWAMLPLISAVVLTIFGGLTIISNDEFFIKIKPTLVNIIFSMILLIGLAKGKGLLKYLFQSAVEMSEEAWKTFSFRWAIFFLFLAGVNEFIWRNFSTDFWVDFKVFGMTTISMVFTICQFPFLKRNMKIKN